MCVATVAPNWSVPLALQSGKSGCNYPGGGRSLITAETKDLRQRSSTHHGWSSLFCLSTVTSCDHPNHPGELGPCSFCWYPVLVCDRPGETVHSSLVWIQISLCVFKFFYYQWISRFNHLSTVYILTSNEIHLKAAHKCRVKGTCIQIFKLCWAETEFLDEPCLFHFYGVCSGSNSAVVCFSSVLWK